MAELLCPDLVQLENDKTCDRGPMRLGAVTLCYDSKDFKRQDFGAGSPFLKKNQCDTNESLINNNEVVMLPSSLANQHRRSDEQITDNHANAR